MRKHLSVKFDIKSLTEEGTFEGDLSVYDIVDLGGDVVERGAFSKSLKENGGRVPLLYQHDPKQPIGYLDLTDTPKALKAKGTLVLEVERAKETYALMRAGVLKGLSIGYETVKDAVENGARKLKEIKLWEGSVVTFPMLPVATIGSVKAHEQKADFNQTLEAIQIYALRYQSMRALENALDSIFYDYDDENPSAAERIQASAVAIDQFRSTYLESYLPRIFEQYGVKFDPRTFEVKAGRRISADSRTQIESAIEKLQALLAEEAAKTAGEPPESALVEQLKSIMEISKWN